MDPLIEKNTVKANIAIAATAVTAIMTAFIFMLLLSNGKIPENIIVQRQAGCGNKQQYICRNKHRRHMFAEQAKAAHHLARHQLHKSVIIVVRKGDIRLVVCQIAGV